MYMKGGVRAKLGSMLASGVETKRLLVKLNKYWSRRRECGIAHSGWGGTPEPAQSRFEIQMVEDR